MKILAGAITDYEGEVRPGRPAGAVLRAAGGRGRRHPDHLPGAEPRPAAHGGRQHLPRPRDGAGRPAGLAGRARDGGPDATAVRPPGRAISPRARVGDLRIGDQQMVEIAKALAFDAAIVIMDEPTSALSDSEVARLFRVIDDLRQGRHHRAVHQPQDERGLHALRPGDGAPRRPVRRLGARGPRSRPTRWCAGWSAARSPR